MPFVKKEVCVRGHKFHAKNTYQRPDGLGKACRACHALRASKAREKKKMQILMEIEERIR